MKNFSQKITLALGALSLVVNLVMMRALPDNVAMQISFGGKLQNYIPKSAFVFSAPAILALMYIFWKTEAKDRYKAIFVAGLIFVVNIVMIVINLRAAQG